MDADNLNAETQEHTILLGNLNLSVRARNVLANNNIRSLEELKKLTHSDLKSFKSCGTKTIQELSPFINEEKKHFSESLQLSERAQNVLKNNNIDSLEQLNQLTEQELMSLKGCGVTVAEELLFTENVSLSKNKKSGQLKTSECFNKIKIEQLDLELSPQNQQLLKTRGIRNLRQLTTKNIPKAKSGKENIEDKVNLFLNKIGLHTHSPFFDEAPMIISDFELILGLEEINLSAKLVQELSQWEILDLKTLVGYTYFDLQDKLGKKKANAVTKALVAVKLAPGMIVHDEFSIETLEQVLSNLPFFLKSYVNALEAKKIDFSMNEVNQIFSTKIENLIAYFKKNVSQNEELLFFQIDNRLLRGLGYGSSSDKVKSFIEQTQQIFDLINASNSCVHINSQEGICYLLPEAVEKMKKLKKNKLAFFRDQNSVKDLIEAFYSVEAFYSGKDINEICIQISNEFPNINLKNKEKYINQFASNAYRDYSLNKYQHIYKKHPVSSFKAYLYFFEKAYNFVQKTDSHVSCTEFIHEFLCGGRRFKLISEVRRFLRRNNFYDFMRKHIDFLYEEAIASGGLIDLNDGLKDISLDDIEISLKLVNFYSFQKKIWIDWGFTSFYNKQVKIHSDDQDKLIFNKTTGFLINQEFYMQMLDILENTLLNELFTMDDLREVFLKAYHEWYTKRLDEIPSNIEMILNKNEKKLLGILVDSNFIVAKKNFFYLRYSSLKILAINSFKRLFPQGGDLSLILAEILAETNHYTSHYLLDLFKRSKEVIPLDESKYIHVDNYSYDPEFLTYIYNTYLCEMKLKEERLKIKDLFIIENEKARQAGFFTPQALCSTIIYVYRDKFRCYPYLIIGLLKSA